MDLDSISHPVSAIAVLISLLVLWPFYFAFLWLSKLSFLPQTIVGGAVGCALMASQSIAQTHRSQHRSSMAASHAHVESAGVLALRRFWPNVSDAEKVRWINVGLNKVWPFFKEASSGLMKLELQSVLNRYEFEAIHEVAIKKIDLGRNHPYVQGIKVSNSGKDEISLDVQLDWRQNEDQEMILHVLTSGPEYTVQVRHFVIYAVLRLTFKPLKEEFPGFAAIVFSIIEHPLVDFQTKVLSGDPKKLKEMRTAVDNILLSALMDLPVWPSRMVVPFITGDYSYLNVRCVGQLHVELLEAKDLANKEITGNSDPYMVLFVQRRQDSVKQSATMHDTSTPVWNEKFVFNIEDPVVQKLTVKVMNTDGMTVETCIGTMEMPINQLVANIQRDIWMDMVGDPTKLHGKIAGRVHFLLEYKPVYSNCTERHDVKAADDEGYSSTESKNIRNNTMQIFGEFGLLNDEEVQNHAITGEKMLSKEPQVVMGVVKNCAPQGLKLLTEEPGVTSDGMVYNHAFTAEKMPSEVPFIENDALLEKNAVGDIIIPQELGPPTEDTGVTTEAMISSESVLSDLERNLSTAEDMKCKQSFNKDSCNKSHSPRWSSIQSFARSDCAKEEDMPKNQAGLHVEIRTPMGIERRDCGHGSNKTGSTTESRDLLHEEGNPDQGSIKLSENYNRRGSNEVIDDYNKFMQEDMFSSEIYEVD